MLEESQHNREVADRALLGGEGEGITGSLAQALGLDQIALTQATRELRVGHALAAGTQLYIYWEAIDTYANTFEQVIRMIQGYLGSGAPDVGEMLEFKASKVPVVAVLEAANPDLAGRIQTRLKERLGAGARSREVESVKYTQSEDGRCGWTSSNST